MPANLEGCLVMGLFIAVVLAIVGGALLLSRTLASEIPLVLAWIPIAGAFIAFTRFSKRHS